MRKQLSIFILQGSHFLTDHHPHGDGLIADSFIRMLSRRGHRIHLVTSNSSVKEPYAENVIWHKLESSWIGGPIGKIEFLVRVRLLYMSISLRENIDIIHQMNPVVRGLSILFFCLKTPVILGTIVGDWPHEQTPSKIATFTKRLLDLGTQSTAKRLLVTSPFAKNRIVSLPSIESKMRIIAHGVDTSKFFPSNNLEINRKILFLNSLFPRKNIRVLLEAFELALSKGLDWSLTIAGAGPDQQLVTRFTSNPSTYGKIVYLGAVDRDAIPALIREHGVLCVPSIGEPFGTSTLEAMSSGLGLVLSNTGGLPYMASKEGAVYFDPHDAHELSNALTAVCMNPLKLQRMRTINRLYAEENYSWEKIVNDLEDVYFECLNLTRN